MQIERGRERETAKENQMGFQMEERGREGRGHCTH